MVAGHFAGHKTRDPPPVLSTSIRQMTLRGDRSCAGVAQWWAARGGGDVEVVSLNWFACLRTHPPVPDYRLLWL